MSKLFFKCTKFRKTAKNDHKQSVVQNRFSEAMLYRHVRIKNNNTNLTTPEHVIHNVLF